MEKALNNSGPAAAKPGHRAKRAEPGRRGAKDALEWLMHTIFLLCGIVAVGFGHQCVPDYFWCARDEGNWPDGFPAGTDLGPHGL